MKRIDEQGWTLIELIGSLSLITLMAAIALPTLIPVGEHLERDMYSALLADELLYAQTQALSRQEEIKVRLHRQQLTVLDGDRRLRQLRLPRHLHLMTNFPRGQIIYRRHGHSRGGTIYLYRNAICIVEIRIQVATGLASVVKK